MSATETAPPPEKQNTEAPTESPATEEKPAEKPEEKPAEKPAEEEKKAAEDPISPTPSTPTAPPVEYKPGPNVILFYRDDEVPYGVFANFYNAPMTIGADTFPTVEHYFQSMKFQTVSEKDFQECVAAPTAKEAAAIGRDRNRKRRDGWGDIKEQVMYAGLKAKFTQHEDLRKVLFSTDDKIIQEHSTKDAFWGDGGDGKGENTLGKLLMNVRDELRKESEKPPVTEEKKENTEEQVEEEKKEEKVEEKKEGSNAPQAKSSPAKTPESQKMKKDVKKAEPRPKFSTMGIQKIKREEPPGTNGASPATKSPNPTPRKKYVDPNKKKEEGESPDTQATVEVASPAPEMVHYKSVEEKLAAIEQDNEVLKNMLRRSRSPFSHSPSNASIGTATTVYTLQSELDKKKREVKQEQERRTTVEAIMMEDKQSHDHDIYKKDCEIRRLGELLQNARSEVDNMKERVKEDAALMDMLRKENGRLTLFIKHQGLDPNVQGMEPPNYFVDNTVRAAKIREKVHSSKPFSQLLRSVSPVSNDRRLKGGLGGLGSPPIKKTPSNDGSSQPPRKSSRSNSPNIGPQRQHSRSPNRATEHKVGHRVTWHGHQGVIRYIGSVHCLGEGTWAGVELSEAGKGEHNGTLSGIRYFAAAPTSSVFATLTELLPPKQFDFSK